MGGVYVGPYTFTDTSTGQTLGLICDDFMDEVHIGESWTATLTPMGGGGSGMFGSTSSMGYQEVAWLSQQMFANLGNAQKVGDIQWAIWAIFDPSLVTVNGTTVTINDNYGSIGTTDADNIEWWLNQASINYGSGSYSDMTIYTPTGTPTPAGDGQPQEYIGVPEPGTLLLIGAGLFSLLAFRRRLSY